MQDAVFDVSSFDLNKAITFSRCFSRIKLSIAAKLTLRCLIDFWNSDNGFVFPKQSTISECTGISVVSISNAISELKENKLIITVKEGSRLNYYFQEQLFIMTGTDKKTLNNNSKNFKDSHKDSLSPYKQINLTNNKQDKLNLKNFLKLHEDPTSFLNNKELAKIVLYNFNKFNIKSQNDLVLIFLLKIYWNFSDKNFIILECLQEEENNFGSMTEKIKSAKQEAERVFAFLKNCHYNKKMVAK